MPSRNPPRDIAEIADQVDAQLRPLPADILRFIVACLADEPGVTVEKTAGRAGIPHRTLSRHLGAAGLPPARVTLRIFRLLVAMFFLIFERLSVEKAAHRAGFGRPATLRHHLKAYFGVSPKAVQSEGNEGWWSLLQRLPAVLHRLTVVILASLALGRELPAQAERAGASVAGRVTDATNGNPLANAIISFEGTALTATSDDQGRYRIEGAPAGPQVLRAIRIGYAPIRRPVTVPISGALTADFLLARSALNLPNLIVTADAVGRARGELGTASVIESEAIRNQTAASLAGILELIPGTTLQPPGLDGVQQFSLRSVPISPGIAIGPNATGPSAASLAAFGTQIVLDGVPISNNVNLQSLGARGELTFATAAGGGIDLRRIPAATIERVEVIRGIPSARFGDLTQGVVLVDTRAGAVTPEGRLRFDPRTVEGTVVGGAGLFQRQTGTASLNLARTRLAPGTRDDLGSRVSAQLAHRLTTNRLTLDTRIDGFQVLEDSPATPELPDVASRSRDNGIRISERARYRLGRESLLEWTAALEADRQRSFTQAPRIRGAMPFTNRLTEGTQDGKFIGGIYVARVDVDGDPRQLYSRLELIAPTSFLGIDHGFRSGLELRREWTGGPGVQFDIEFPPQVGFNGVQGYDRPRRFDAIQALTTSAFYLDDRISRAVGRTLVNVQAGLRLDLLHQGSGWTSGVRDAVLGPRLQVEVAPGQRIRLRAGAGRVAKVPALASLAPGVQYYDLVNFNYYANLPAERRAILTTRILDRTNPDVKTMRADKAEAGVELDLGTGGRVALVGYADRIRNAIGIRAQPTFLVRDRYAVDSTTIGTGRPPEVLEPPFASDTIPTLIEQPANNLDLRSRGLELSAILPEIPLLRTRIDVQGAWAWSRLDNGGISFVNSFFDFQVDERISRAPYWQALTRKGERLLLTTRLIHQQPGAGLVITGTVQITLREVRQDQGSTDSLSFSGYMTRAGELVPVPVEDRGRPEYHDLRVARAGLIDPQKAPADWLFSLQVSKTLPLDGRLSFYAFNAFDRVGSYGTRTAVPRFFAPVRFGLEMTMPLRAP